MNRLSFLYVLFIISFSGIYSSTIKDLKSYKASELRLVGAYIATGVADVALGFCVGNQSIFENEYARWSARSLLVGSVASSMWRIYQFCRARHFLEYDVVAAKMTLNRHMFIPRYLTSVPTFGLSLGTLLVASGYIGFGGSVLFLAGTAGPVIDFIITSDHIHEIRNKIEEDTISLT